MSKYVCSICGYVYDESAGIPDEEIAPGTKWNDLPNDWVCPLCTANKEAFNKETTDEEITKPSTDDVVASNYDGEMSDAMLSVLFSNLSKGSEKQYRPEEAELFNKLSLYFESKAITPDQGKFSEISDMIKNQVSSIYPNAKELSKTDGDRGALRALVWNEKVTKILSSLVDRYSADISKLDSKNVYVCEICGFVYTGDEPPEICPVCKVPNLKIQEIKRRKA